MLYTWHVKYSLHVLKVADIEWHGLSLYDVATLNVTDINSHSATHFEHYLLIKIGKLALLWKVVYQGSNIIIIKMRLLMHDMPFDDRRNNNVVSWIYPDR